MEKKEITSWTRKIARNTIYNIAGQIFVMALVFILTPYIVGKLGLIRYGIWGIVSALMGYFRFFDFGLKNAFAKYIAEYNAKKETAEMMGVLNTGLVFYAAVSIVLFIIAYFFTKPLVVFLNIEPVLRVEAYRVIILGVIFFCLTIITSPFEALQHGLQRMDIFNIVVIGISVLMAAGTVFFLEAGYGLTGLMVNNIIVTLIKGTVNILIARRLLGGIRFNPRDFLPVRFYRLFAFGFKMQLTRIGTIVAHQTDKLLITYFLSLGLVGYYHLGCSVVYYLNLIPALLVSALMPAFSEMEAMGNRGKLRYVYLRCTRYVSFAVFPIFCFAILISSHFISLWMGPGYSMSANVIRILAAGWMVNALVGVGVSASMAIDKPQLMSYSAVSMAILNIGLSIFLIKRFGFFGAALGTSIAVVAGSLIFIILINKELNVSFREFTEHFRVFLMLSLASAPFFLAAEAASRLFSDPASRINQFIILVIESVIFFSAYLGGLIIIKPFETADEELLRDKFPRAYLVLRKALSFVRGY